MIPGIDPTVDLAFKKVFGSETRRNLTRSLIDAVLQPAPWRRIVELELLNPYTERTALDDKLSILDIRARDDKGRLFNVEMQMVTTASLPERFLYYWARGCIHGSCQKAKTIRRCASPPHVRATSWRNWSVRSLRAI